MSAMIDVVAKTFSHGEPLLQDAIKEAILRSQRYDIPLYKDTPKLGRCWLVAGGPRSQTYWSEDRIIKNNQHDPSCTPAYLCDKCIDAIIDAVDKPNKDDIIHDIHEAAAKRAEQNQEVTQSA